MTAVPKAAGAIKDALQTYNTDYPIEKPGNLIYHICFVKGTLVYGKNKFEQIENLNVGDSVYSYNFDKRAVELNRIINTLNRETDTLYEISTRVGKISVTGEHPFYVINKGWVKAKDLVKKDRLKSANNLSEIVVLKTKKLSRTVIVYNIEVGGSHNYFVTESYILVHNKSIGEIKKE